MYKVIQTNSSQDTTGVVRSHPGFPWNYPRPLAPSWGWGWDKNKKGLDLLNPGRDKNCPRHWNIVRHELRAPAKMTTLRLTVGRLRLARGDRLDVCSENGSGKIWLVGFLTPSSTTRIYPGRVLRMRCENFTFCHTRDSGETMTSVSAGHIILTPTQPVESGRPQRESNSGPPHQKLRALPTELLPPPFFSCQLRSVFIVTKKMSTDLCFF